MSAVALCLGSACSERGAAYYRPIAEADYPKADGPGEVLAPHEADDAARLAAIIHAHLLHLYGTGPVRRDAHPKAHGCARATVTVHADVPQALRRGLFAAPAEYPAIIRFSNANEAVQRSDHEKDGRGMAIKIYDVPGQPLTVAPDDRPSQDIIMINYPTFLVASPDDYVTLVGYVDSGDRLTQLLQPLLVFTAIGWKGTMNALGATSSLIDNPLNTRYWSMVPYQLGTGADAQAVKYSARPCQQRPVVIPGGDDPNYLRHAMSATLAAGGACMELMVQPRTSDAMSVEDSRYEWPEAQAPFVPVATITVEQQIFDTADQNAACEALSYSPWHALPEHKPLGAVNRLREAIYQRISALRRETAQNPVPAPLEQRPLEQRPEGQQ
ncbi:catalase family protein [Nitrospirillum sp. BR 11828]|uniref:catalase family protein n=1 Tax=Nitrospirillum sp. BR 11828 TaxID=3104325 RepID=UPI002ACAAEB5|nr:catalase family protein [Nitrospirillum sp. BR 11828]MDZ5650385.1 catalase family protein [Nitrospirillum sp. BR 11828]